MQIKRSLLAALAVGMLAFGASVQAQEKASPAGTYIWTQAGRGGGPDRTNTLVLKVEGTNVTGTVTTPGRGGQTSEAKVSNGKIKGDEVSFDVVREFGGNSMTQKYSGKVTGEAIKGKIDMERDGQTMSRDWEAKRQK